jgi:hypothetical protein
MTTEDLSPSHLARRRRYRRDWVLYLAQSRCSRRLDRTYSLPPSLQSLDVPIIPQNMAGEVRQPIDLKSLERWIDKNVPEIKTPLDLKQVSQQQHTLPEPPRN